MPVMGGMSFNHNTRQSTRASLDLESIDRRASAENNTGQYTPIFKVGIKIPDPTENWILATELEGRYSDDHATALNNI